MNNLQKNEKQFLAPRSQGMSLIQFWSISLLVGALILPILPILKERTIYAVDRHFLSFVSLPLLFIGLVMLCLQILYRTRIIYDSDKNCLYKIEKGVESKCFDLNKVTSILSKAIIGMGCKYYMIAEENESQSRIIFNEDLFFGINDVKRWGKFSEKISEATGLPLKRERWEEDYNGKLSLILNKDHATNTKRNLLLVSIPLFISFAGAIGYKLTATAQALVVIGLSVVAINIILSFLFVKFNRDKMGDWADNSFIMMFYILTLSIPYATFYLLFVFLVNGIRFPENFM